MIKSVILLFLLSLTFTNVWDNVYSQTLADSPIIMSESLNFDFKIKQYNLDANVDFNSNLQVITYTTYYDLVLMKMQVLKVQVDLHTLIITYSVAAGSGCKRLQISALKDVKITEAKLGMDKLFLINLLFKFVGKTQAQFFGPKPLNLYKFQPFLLGKENNKLNQVKTKIQQSTKEKLDVPDNINLDIQLFVGVNSATGAIEQIYEGQKQKVSIPFKLTSKVKQVMPCSAEIHQFTNNDFSSMVKIIVDNKGNYQKLFK